MGKYSVPDHIRAMRPEGTMVKLISNQYYVYPYLTYKDDNGKQKIKMGKLIGYIREGIGFVPNDNYSRDTEITTRDFGEYAVVMENSKKTLNLLKDCFNLEEAVAIYVVSLIHVVQEFVHMKRINTHFEQSFLPLVFPTLNLGYDAIAALYDTLGRKQTNVLKFQERLVADSSREIAIDGHVIGCCSTENDLAQKGYRFSEISEPQINLLMAYDINTEKPLISRIYAGNKPDKVSVKDFIGEVELKDMLFIVDRGFYSVDNLSLFSANGNAYIIPLSPNLKIHKSAVNNLTLTNRFKYRKGRKRCTVEYRDMEIEGNRVLVCRDMDKADKEITNYRRHIDLNHKSYTEENLAKFEPYFGLITLQTSIWDKSVQQIYELYKKRWKIETFYNVIKNKADFKGLHQFDYYKIQGLGFIILVSSLIYKEFELATQVLKGKCLQDCILEAKMVKASLRHGKWKLDNCLKGQVDLFAKLNTSMDLNHFIIT